MSSSSASKNKIAKDKLSLMKPPKFNQFSNDMQGLKISLNEVIKDYEPKLKVVYQEPMKTRLPNDDDRVYCPVIIVVIESVQRQVIQALFWKHYPLSGAALPIFLSFSEKFSTINSLKLEDTRLQEGDITLLAEFLRKNPNVNELNLSGNIYNENFKRLIEDTNLKYLILKFCGINHLNLKEFLEPMKKAYTQPLVYLNLSNNRFGDEGAKILADMLRVNRILIALNVAANEITDVGARDILSSLRKICLNQDEISVRRKIYYQYYIKKYEEIAEIAYSPTKEEEELSISPSPSPSTSSRVKRKSKTAKNKSRKSYKSPVSETGIVSTPNATSRNVSSAPTSPSSVMLPYAEISDLIATLDFELAYHPFVKETTVDGFQFFCRGNFILSHLNLSFNQLSIEVLKEIQEVLKYQISKGSPEEGLKNISIFGNNLKSEEAESLQKDLDDMLMTKKTSRTRPSVTSSSSSKTMSKKGMRGSK